MKRERGRHIDKQTDKNNEVRERERVGKKVVHGEEKKSDGQIESERERKKEL